MSVVPGKSGQKYIESTHEKMIRVLSKLNEHKFQGYIEADGGVTLENAGTCFADGARAFVGGSVIIEVIFSIQGMGLASFSAIMSNDMPMIMALMFLYAVLTLSGILIIDLLYAAVDPRITFD